MLQVLFLLFILFTHYQVEWTGEEITLQSAPIDPYDPFRGAYVTLAYEEERVAKQVFQEEDYSYGDLLYITFKQDGNVHRVDQVFRTPPKGRNYLTAKYLYAEGSHNRVDFMLGRYYTNERNALELEQQAHRLHVHIKMKDGRAVVSGITVLDK
ncbi:GDYXXLXY domain-containing protein [Caldalkalibacillus mannanilyticus]|uniref:GDYXXLXY domain-containing protein n=1 Tax=Caldalkalibacillus mannanilyticus TaxID=1418 RepID=UPI000469968E|nr:GDYXXLXY domain-containing protein [Caldalkalibacillus mannanilyticus]